MKRSAPLLALVLCLGFTSPALAAEEDRDPAEVAREGIERFMKALELFIDAIPQYEAPFINENGDIIIRRKHKKDAEPGEDEETDGMEETRT